MVGMRYDRTLGSAGTLGLACGMLVALHASPVRAYSNFADYVRPIEEGGGGGRLFTGAPADGHGCEVCHRGAEGANLDVIGLPSDGYAPGETYEITLAWPEPTHIALMAEFADLAGQPAGVLALTPYDSWEAGQQCENGFPAADVCRPDAADPTAAGCCRDFDSTRDACSLPDSRSVFWVPDCGSKLARLQWTAPNPAVGDVWFSTVMVTSDVGFDALGDGVTPFRTRLPPAGALTDRTAAVGDCGVEKSGQAHAFWPAVTMTCLLAAGLRRRRQRGRP